ncbi:hypothetical protein, partial [Streptomyces sp. NPDC001978]|uniref:hypothetical protein n=1 Tax=Streptomyces sp. NPDC001978 TaxID=3364627 RepID=UPI003681A16A
SWQAPRNDQEEHAIARPHQAPHQQLQDAQSSKRKFLVSPASRARLLAGAWRMSVRKAAAAVSD